MVKEVKLDEVETVMAANKSISHHQMLSLNFDLSVDKLLQIAEIDKVSD